MSDKLTVAEMRELLAQYSDDDRAKIVGNSTAQVSAAIHARTDGKVALGFPALPTENAVLDFEFFVKQTGIVLHNLTGMSLPSMYLINGVNSHFISWLWKSIIRRKIAGENVPESHLQIAKLIRADGFDGKALKAITDTYPSADDLRASDYVTIYRRMCDEQKTIVPHDDFDSSVWNFERDDGKTYRGLRLSSAVPDNVGGVGGAEHAGGGVPRNAGTGEDE